MVTATIRPTLTLHTVSGTDRSGAFFSIAGNTQGNPGRPVQPRATVLITGPHGALPHGTLLLTGQYTEITGFDPYVSRPVTDVSLPEPGFAGQGWFPDQPFLVNRFGGADRLVVVPGQYNGRTSTERLYKEMTLGVYYSYSSDFTPPAIVRVEARQFQDQASFAVFPRDDSGIHRVLVTWSDGSGWQSFDLSPSPLGGWRGSLSGLRGEVTFFIQVVDRAGNVTVSSNKGAFFEPEVSRIFLPLVMKQ